MGISDFNNVWNYLPDERKAELSERLVKAAMKSLENLGLSTDEQSVTDRAEDLAARVKCDPHGMNAGVVLCAAAPQDAAENTGREAE